MQHNHALRTGLPAHTTVQNKQGEGIPLELNHQDGNQVDSREYHEGHPRQKDNETQPVRKQRNVVKENG